MPGLRYYIQNRQLKELDRESKILGIETLKQERE